MGECGVWVAPTSVEDGGGRGRGLDGWTDFGLLAGVHQALVGDHHHTIHCYRGGRGRQGGRERNPLAGLGWSGNGEERAAYALAWSVSAR